MPTEAHLVDGQVLVWDAAGALELRQAHRIVGEAIGGLTGAKQQTAVKGLPLLLLPEEVCLALQNGWISLYTLAVHCSDASPDDSGMQPAEAQDPNSWQAALANKTAFKIPACNSASALSTRSNAEWVGPTLPEDRDKARVFQDIHSKGFYITSGAKFGADFLAYPGDPMVYHAMYCIRVWPPTKPLDPVLLSGAVRGSHAARKHLVLASVSQDESDAAVTYTTFGPAAEFGT